jgi:hypothetical protein
VSRELSWIQAAEILGCTPLSLRRWRLRYQKFGMHGLVDGRGRRSGMQHGSPPAGGESRRSEGGG